MMDDVAFYFNLGWHHIISRDATDHILFIAALTAIYLLNNWRSLLILVTAFTVGHSLTLALSVYKLIKINSSWVEFLIPVTIMVTAIFNVLQKERVHRSFKLNYFFALFFGLIHGLGFANTIRFMLAKNENIGLPLLSFNVGLEAGQLVVVFLILLCSWLLVNKAGLKQRWWILSLSAICFILASYMAASRWPL